MDIEKWNKQKRSNTGGGNGNGPGNTGGNTSGHNATTNSPDAVNQVNETHQMVFEERAMESSNKHVTDIEEPLRQSVSQADHSHKHTPIDCQRVSD